MIMHSQPRTFALEPRNRRRWCAIALLGYLCASAAARADDAADTPAPPTIRFAPCPATITAREDDRPPPDIEVVPGVYCLFVRFRDGRLYGMGENRIGTLGIGDAPATREPQRITDKPIRTVASYSHTLLVTEDGALLGTGENYHGQLGLGDLETRFELATIVDKGVVDAAVGRWCSMFLKKDGTLWAMGDNKNGILGVGNPHRMGGSSTFTEGKDAKTPVRVDTDVVSLAMSNNMALYLKKDGTLWASGLEPILQPGNPLNIPRKIYSGDFIKATCTSSTVFLLKPDGSLWSMGAHYGGALGRETDGPSAEWGVVCKTGVTDVVGNSRRYSAVYFTEDGAAWGVGEISGGKPRKLPIPAARVVSLGPGENLLMLDRNGAAWGTGKNTSLMLNPKDRRKTFNKPVRIFPGTTATDIASIPFASFAIDDNGALWTVGWSPDPSMGGEPFHLEDEDQRLASPTPRRIRLPDRVN